MSLPTGDRIAFTVQQAAEAANLPLLLVAEAVADGRLTAHQAGPHRVILRADLERFIASLPRAQAGGSASATADHGWGDIVAAENRRRGFVGRQR